MKTFILTDDCINEPIVIEAETYDEAEKKAKKYYGLQLNPLEVARDFYNAQIIELSELNNIDDYE